MGNSTAIVLCMAMEALRKGRRMRWDGTRTRYGIDNAADCGSQAQ